MADDPPPVLSYGRQPRRAWRRWALRLGLVAALVLGGIAAYWFAEPRVARWWAYREIDRWLAAVPGVSIPPGTLLYSERPADAAAILAGGGVQREVYNASGVFTRQYATLASAFPHLRTVVYDSDRAPVLDDFYDVLYHGEHLVWDNSGNPAGPPTRALVAVSLTTPAADGRPVFVADTLWPKRGPAGYDRMRANTSPDDPSGQPMTNLRLYAGHGHDGEPDRFTLPFESDGGRGRFEFRTDTDASDGGQLTPDVWIEWDDTPATRPH